MRLKLTTAQVPDLSDPATPREAEGGLTSEVLAEFGRAAVDVGTPDRGQGEDRTDAVDALANIMHWLRRLGLDPADCVEAARRHFEAEIETVEEQAVRILGAAGFDTQLHHGGPRVWVAEVRSNDFPGRHICVTDSEGDNGGPFLVGRYPDSEDQAWFEVLSGACTERELVPRVSRALEAEEI